MSDPRRQHIVAAVSNFLRTLRDLLFPLILIFLVGGREDGLFSNPYFMIFFLVFLLISGFIQWAYYTYRVENGELRIEYGIFVKKRSYIPKHRIQVIDISSGILQRMFGLVSLNVQTAGGSTPGATINALTKEDALWIKETLSKDENQPDAEAAENLSAEEPAPLFRLTWGRLILAGTTSGSFGIALSIVGTIFAQTQTVVSDDVVIDYIETFFNSGTMFFISLAVFLIFISWVLSIIGTVLSYANFEVHKKPKELIISRGLFEKKQITIPYSRIQGIRLQEGIIRQPLGFCTLYIDSAGYGEQSGKSTTLFPLLRKEEAMDYIQNITPEYRRDIELCKPPARALRRYLIRTMIPVSIMIAAFYWLLPFGYFALLLAPPGLWLGYLRYRAAAAGTDRDTLTITYRNLAKTTVWIKRYRIQSMNVWDNWFQRKKDLKSATVTIASSDTGASFSIRDIDKTEAIQFIGWTEPGFIKNRMQALPGDGSVYEIARNKRMENSGEDERSNRNTASDMLDIGV
ncbi:MAG: PH domain-containing protein [Balneolales bacterium]|nr:PH domain-containing protein [Balneolales bacterium]